ncbi:MAG: hypothetical protein ABJO02_10805 [Reichenbachiella sp.]|uniref:hypothetical protein n=1 Tax=Reichenbachiella sp. TaxID=2184521 RepID=UPI003298959A
MRVLIIILFLAFQSAQAQNYTVIHVIGKIYDSKSGAYLKSGSKLSEDSKLRFDTPNARAAALSSSRGRYVIQKQSNQGSSSDLAYTLSAVLSPARGKMSTRAGGINNQMDFVKKFAEGPIAIVGGRYATAVSATSYPSDDTRFFYASYLFNGEAINKKLDVIDGSLVFDTNTFYAVDGIAIEAKQTTDTKLFYYDSEKEESTEITSLNFAVVSNAEFESIKNSLADLSDEEQLKSLQEIISSLYGSCELANIEAALQAMN